MRAGSPACAGSATVADRIPSPFASSFACSALESRTEPSSATARLLVRGKLSSELSGFARFAGPPPHTCGVWDLGSTCHPPGNREREWRSATRSLAGADPGIGAPLTSSAVGAAVARTPSAVGAESCAPQLTTANKPATRPNRKARYDPLVFMNSLLSRTITHSPVCSSPSFASRRAKRAETQQALIHFFVE
jgi:hypothetical protein